MNGICFASYVGFEGCIQSCRNAAAVLGGTWAVVTPASGLPAAALGAGTLVLSSWHDCYEAILDRRGPSVVLRWHSTVLQSEVGEERLILSHVVGLLDRGRAAALWVDDPELPPILRRRGVTFVPNVLSGTDYEGVTPARLRGVHVSLFGAVHPRKNVLVQSAAFDRARRAAGGDSWTLHLNGHSFDDPAYERWLDIAGIPYVDHGWLSRDEYLSLVAAMNAGLCATLAESYCYVAADHVALNVPIVPSPAIACLGDDIGRARPDSVVEVAQSLTVALTSRDAIAAAQRSSLHARASANAEIARAALAGIRSAARRDADSR